MRKRYAAVGTSEWWEDLRAVAGARRLAARAAGATEADAELLFADFFQPLRDLGGALGDEAALWQARGYGVAARLLDAGSSRGEWLRREEIRGLEQASRAADPWVRDAGFKALLSRLEADQDGRGMRAAIDRWKVADPGNADEIEEQWSLQEAVAHLPPLTDSERRRIAGALATFAQRHPAPDVPILGTATGDLTPREMAEHVRQNTRTGDLVVRMISSARVVAPLDEILSAWERSYVPQAAISHLRRYPVEVRAQGPAAVFAAVSPEQALDSFVRQGIKRGQIIGATSTADCAVLRVPPFAPAQSYPRSINHIPIRITRVTSDFGR